MSSKAHILPEMTWPEAKKALAQAKLALIPVGSFEQHGPHGTFEVDTGRAYGFGKLLAARMYPQVVLAPPVNIGVSYHHLNFPGTITLRPETFMAVVYDVVWSLKQHGIGKFLILNGHGGNIPSLGVVIVKLGEGFNLAYAYRFDEITANGALGDATQASEELGWAIVEAALDHAIEFLQDFMADDG
jgi:creatinine amidohydrolase